METTHPTRRPSDSIGSIALTSGAAVLLSLVAPVLAVEAGAIGLVVFVIGAVLGLWGLASALARTRRPRSFSTAVALLLGVAGVLAPAGIAAIVISFLTGPYPFG